MLRYVLTALIGLLLVATTMAQEGKLDQAREEVRTEPAKPPKQDRPSFWERNPLAGLDDPELEGQIWLVGGLVAVWAITSPVWVPHVAFDDGFALPGRYLPYPYAEDGRFGLMFINRPPPKLSPQNELLGIHPHVVVPPVEARTWSVRLSLEESNDFDRLNRIQGSVLLMTTSRWGFSGNFGYFTERLSCGCTDEFFLGDANVVFRFAQNENVQFWGGAGIRFLNDTHGTDAGFNLTYGADWAPARPFLFSAQADVDMLGHAWVEHARFTAGAIWQRYELYTGYDWLRIGHVDLHGPILGVRIWF